MFNVFVGILEQKILDQVPKPFCHVRYGDDTFARFSSPNEALKFYQCQNNHNAHFVIYYLTQWGECIFEMKCR